MPLQNMPTARKQRETLLDLLTRQDLDFHEQVSNYASHNFHSFPAKFPPQLPNVFIQALTRPGDLVLDPMSGSGTTVLEARLLGRRGVGFDIDPLAVTISCVKSSCLNTLQAAQVGREITLQAAHSVEQRSSHIAQALQDRWDAETRQFIDYWFESRVQIELMALLLEIEKIPDLALRRFFELAFSAIIITKSGGVSLARDLAHTRPHRAKLIYSQQGEILEGAEFLENPSPNLKHSTKNLRSPIQEFDKRVQNNLKGLLALHADTPRVQIAFGNAQNLPLPANSIDLIVTSPPYASNAIDYMRAHKFSLAWLGHPMDALSDKRKEYIGGESITEFTFEKLPPYPAQVVSEISALDSRKGQTLHRYYSEMTRALGEMRRVLKPGSVAIVVVGSSEMRGRDTETEQCLAEIGRALGFEVPAIGVRSLDRDRRMMPAGEKIDRQSQIQKRMHEEDVIGFYKPEEKDQKNRRSCERRFF